MTRILSILFLVWAVGAGAATYYASSSGSGSGCTVGTPCTLQTALNTAQAGDTIIANSGTYASSLETQRAGPITLRSADRDYTTVLLSAKLSVNHHDYTIEGLRMRNFEIATAVERIIVTNCWGWNTNPPNSFDNKFWRLRGNNWIIDSCLFSGNAQDGSSGSSFLWSQGSGGIIRNNTFENNNGHDCILPFGRNHVIESNLFRGLTTSGQAVEGDHGDHADIVQGYTSTSGSAFENITFRYNTITNCNATPFQISNVHQSPYFTGFLVHGNLFINSRIQGNFYIPYVRIYQNTVIQTGGFDTGLRWENKPTGHGVASNGSAYNNLLLLITGPEDGSGVFQRPAGDTLTDYNIITQDDNSGFTSFSVGANSINGGYTVAQLLTDYANGDYTPVASSPADHGNGTDLSAFFTVDKNGNAYNNGGWPIGAIALSGGGGDVTAPVISSVVATPAETSATITFTTSESAVSGVEYGTTTGYGSDQTNDVFTISHSINITGLSPSTLYHYRVHATDAAGNDAVTSDATFTTSDAPLLGYNNDLTLNWIQATNTTGQLSVTITNIGGGSLSWSASVGGSPFSINGTSSGSLSADQTATINVDYDPTAAALHNDTLTITGGGGGTIPLKGIAYLVQPISGIDATLATFDNTGGQEWTVGSGYIVQEPTVTDPEQAARAILGFEITSAGDYLIKGGVNAADTSRDSFFIEANAAPTNPEDIWDIPTLTSGFEQRTVGKRGSGSPTVPEFFPASFTFSEGIHYIDLRGRERETYLSNLVVEAASPPPPAGASRRVNPRSGVRVRF